MDLQLGAAEGYNTLGQLRLLPDSAMTFHKNLIRLQAAPQEYEWGRQGSSSLAARLAQNAIGPSFKLDENKTYAEVCLRCSICSPLP